MKKELTELLFEFVKWWDVVRILHIHMHYPIIYKVAK